VNLIWSHGKFVRKEGKKDRMMIVFDARCLDVFFLGGIGFRI